MTTGEKLAVTLYRDKYADKALPIYAIILFVFATMCNSYSFQIKKKKRKKQKKRNPRYLVPHQIVLLHLFFHRSSNLSSSLFSSVIPLFHRPSDTRFRIQEEKKKKSNNFANSKWTFDLRNRR